MQKDPQSPKEQENLAKLENVLEKAEQIVENLPENKYIYLILGQANTKARFLSRAQL